MSCQIRVFTPSSLLSFFIPIAALIYAVLGRNFLFLDYVHVITGGTWTGIDLFMGLVMSRVLRSLDPETRSKIIMRLTPLMLLFMPSLASTAITAGIYVAQGLGIFSIHNPYIIAAGVVVFILSVQGFGIILPNEVLIFMELRKGGGNRDKIVKLGMRNVYVSGSQVVFQIAIIFIMAILTVGI